MDSVTQSYFNNLEAEDKQVQLEALNHILAITEHRVDWAYEVWETLMNWLTDPDNHRRSRAAQFLANLAISDPEKRMLTDFAELWKVTKDPKFVTARHSLQSIWRVGLAGAEQQEMVIQHFTDRFTDGVGEKNYTLIRYDMIEGLRKLYDRVNDERIKQIAMELIELEEDSKYRKKYMTAWK